MIIRKSQNLCPLGSSKIERLHGQRSGIMFLYHEAESPILKQRVQSLAGRVVTRGHKWNDFL